MARPIVARFTVVVLLTLPAAPGLGTPLFANKTVAQLEPLDLADVNAIAIPDSWPELMSRGQVIGEQADGWMWLRGSTEPGAMLTALHVDDPAGTATPVFVNLPGWSNAVLTPEDDGLWILGVSDDSAGAIRIRTADLTVGTLCAPPERARVTALPDAVFPADPATDPVAALTAIMHGAMYNIRYIHTIAYLPEDRLCLTSPTGVWCLDLARGRFEELVSAAQIEATFPVDPGAERMWVSHEGSLLTVPGGAKARFGGLVGTPDGRLYFTVDLAPRGAGEGPDAAIDPVVENFTRALVVRRPDGSLEPVVSFFHQVSGLGVMDTDSWPHGPLAYPLRDPWEIVLWPELDAVAVYAQYTEYNNENTGGDDQAGWLGGSPYGNPGTVRQGWGGHAMVVAPLNEPGWGRVPLSDGIVRRMRCSEGAYTEYCYLDGRPPRFWTRPDGRLGITLHQYPDGDERFTIALDQDAADLDEDGLTGAAERGAGTSRWLADSDGGGSDDFVESQLAHTDPLVATDDPAGRVRLHPPIRYGPSRLIRFRLGDTFDPGLPQLDVPRVTGNAGPFCIAGRCYGPDGEAVATYGIDLEHYPGAHYGPYYTTRNGVIAFDGSFVVEEKVDGVYRTFFADGRCERWVSQADIERLAPPVTGGWIDLGGARTVFPVDRDHLWVVTHDYQTKVLLFDGTGAGRLVFDAEVARCEARLGPCDDRPRPEAKTLNGVSLDYANLTGTLSDHELDYRWVELLGYEPETERLRIGLYGSWDRYIVGLHASEPPLVLATTEDVIVDTPYPIAPWSAERLPWFDPLWLPLGPGERMTHGGFRDPYGAPIPGAIDIHAGVFDQKTQPFFAVWGDTLLYIRYASTRGQDGLWELVRFDDALEPGHVVLFARPADGLDGNYVVEPPRVYASPARGGLFAIWEAPDLLVEGVRGLDVTADGALCLADGSTLHRFAALADDGRMPRNLLGRHPLRGAADCAYRADGTLVVLQADPPALLTFDPATGAFAPERDLAGTGAGVPEELVRRPDGTFDVRWSTPEPERPVAWTAAGEPVTWRGGPLVGIGERLLKAPEPLGVPLVVRPDGRIVAYAEQQLKVYDPERDLVQPLNILPFRPDEPIGLALVPGGAALDPWTGAPLVAAAPGAADVREPAGDGAPAGGGGSGGASSGGCATPGSAAPMGLPLLLGLVGLGARCSRMRASAKTRR